MSILNIQSTLVISNSNGLSEILRDIRLSTIRFAKFRKKMNPAATFNKYVYVMPPEVRDIYLKYCGKDDKFLLFSTIFYYLLLDFHVYIGTRFSLRDKRLFEISEVEITRVNCTIIL